jgi:hypothetical protein
MKNQENSFNIQEILICGVNPEGQEGDPTGEYGHDEKNARKIQTT